jgi:hypothetical protein
MVVSGRALICASVNLHRGTGPGSSGNSSGRESRKQSYRLATDRDQRLTPSAVDSFLPRRNPVPHRPGTRSLRMPPTPAPHTASLGHAGFDNGIPVRSYAVYATSSTNSNTG